jgi:hypothetical protein
VQRRIYIVPSLLVVFKVMVKYDSCIHTSSHKTEFSREALHRSSSSSLMDIGGKNLLTLWS